MIKASPGSAEVKVSVSEGTAEIKVSRQNRPPGLPEADQGWIRLALVFQDSGLMYQSLRGEGVERKGGLHMDTLGSLGEPCPPKRHAQELSDTQTGFYRKGKWTHRTLGGGHQLFEGTRN